jgi:amino acid adenylation domain-containing protein
MTMDSNKMEADVPQDYIIHGLFEECVQKLHSNIAVSFEERSLTYCELNEKANQLAHYLLKLAVEQNTLIAISMERSLELFISIVGVLKSGCAYVPLDPTHPEIWLMTILEDNKAPILIIKSNQKEKFIRYRGQLVLIDNDWEVIKTNSVLNPCCSVNPENLAYVIYTSGSTGRPKGVLIEHKSVVNYIRWFGAYSSYCSKHSIDFSSNFIFDMAVTTSIAPLALGLHVIVCPEEIKRDISQYLNFLQKNNINLVKLTPSYFKFLLQEAKDNPIDLPSLQTIILGGENLHTIDCAHWLAIYPKHILFNEYGPTETTVAVTQYKVTKENIHKLGLNVPIGKPGPNMNCWLLDDDGFPVSVGSIGELYIGGICLARGYLNQKELTRERFINNPFNNGFSSKLYRTGDLCRYLPDGNMEYIERIDDQVKIRGFRIEPSEIAICLESHPAIKEAVVIAREIKSEEKQLVAYYVPQDIDIVPSVSEFRQYLKQRFADYMIPALFIMLEKLPLTSSGKLDKKALPEPDFSVLQIDILPRTILEQKLVDIWLEELNLERISIESNFFELGGHSLAAARIVSKIKNATGKKIDIEDLYKAPTISKLGVVITHAQDISKTVIFPSQAFDSSKTIPLSDFQFLFWVSDVFEPKTKKLNIFARKRVFGKIDIKALSFAFESVFKNNEILSYQIPKYTPLQYLKKNLKFDIVEQDISKLTEQEMESELKISLDGLINYYPWKKSARLIIAKLFYLKNEMSELQVCTPHIISDDASMEILFSDLSEFYLNYNTKEMFINFKNPQYSDYVLWEHNNFDRNLDKDMAFWEKYLKDVNLCTFSANKIVAEMEPQRLSYSTYLEITEQELKNLLQTCAKNQVSITDILCASTGLALKKYLEFTNGKKILINIIKSTRDTEIFDKTIGCFLRLDPVKMNINDELSLIELSKRIQKSRIDTEIYQSCASIAKIACMNKSRWRNNRIRNYFIKKFVTLYAKILHKLKLQPKVLMKYADLISLRKKQDFLVNMNIRNNFITLNKNQNINIFGFKQSNVSSYQYDLLNINNVLDLTFLKDENLNKTYLVVSSNMQLSFREQIGKEIINAGLLKIY